MINPISKAYKSLDDAVMYGVNSAVHAWNWTTGETKADLANKLLTVAPIFECSGSLYSSSWLTPVALLYLFLSHAQQKYNVKCEELERKGIETGALSLESEWVKRHSAILGPLWLGIAGIQLYYSYLPVKKPKAATLLAIGNSLRALSFYVMRSDYLSPKKNCFQRGWEKFKETISKYQEHPQGGIATARE